MEIRTHIWLSILIQTRIRKKTIRVIQIQQRKVNWLHFSIKNHIFIFKTNVPGLIERCSQILNATTEASDIASTATTSETENAGTSIDQATIQ